MISRHAIRSAGYGLVLGILVTAATARPAPRPARPRAGAAGGWLNERAVDLLRWPYWFARAAPIRSQRIKATLAAGRDGWAAFRVSVREAGGIRDVLSRAREHPEVPALWIAVIAAQVFDLLSGPEAAEIALRGLTRSTPLTEREEAEGRALLGEDGLSWSEVRVAEGGILGLAFGTNKHRAFTLWHTINLPGRGGHTRSNLAIVIHELVHVYQYEQVGSAYVPQALSAQHSAEGYDYGGAEGLVTDRAAGLAYRDYNREQQAQIVQDYFNTLHPPAGDNRTEEKRQEALACFAPCVAEMRAGLI